MHVRGFGVAVAAGCLAGSAALLGGCTGDAGNGALPTFSASTTTTTTSTTTTVSQQAAVDAAIRRYEDAVQGMFGNDPFDEARLAGVAEAPWLPVVRKWIVDNKKQATAFTGPYTVRVSKIVVDGHQATATVCSDSSQRTVVDHGKAEATPLGSDGLEFFDVRLRRTDTWRVYDLKLQRTGSC